MTRFIDMSYKLDIQEERPEDFKAHRSKQMCCRGHQSSEETLMATLHNPKRSPEEIFIAGAGAGAGGLGIVTGVASSVVYMRRRTASASTSFDEPLIPA